MRQTTKFSWLLITLSLLLAACQPKSSTPLIQNEHAQDGSFAASVSDSGRYAIVSSLYHGVALWDLQQNGLKYVWNQTPEGSLLTFEDGDTADSMSSSNFVFATAIADDDSHAVLADKESFTVWDMQTGENVGYWQVRKSKVRDIPKSQLGYWQARTKRGKSNDQYQDFELLDDKKCIAPVAARGERCIVIGRLRAIDISNNGNHVLIGKSNGIVVHINIKTGRRLEFLGHQTELLDENNEPIQINNAINSVEMSPNGRYAISGSSDHTAYLWDTRTGQVIHKFRHSARVVNVALDKKARYAFTSDSGGQSSIWDIKTGKLISNLKFINRQEIFTSARFSDNGHWLLTGAPTRELTLWQISTGKQLQQWNVTPRKDSRPASAVVYSAAFINNESQIISESSSGLSEVWEIKL